MPESEQRGSRAQPPGHLGLPRGHGPPRVRKACCGVVAGVAQLLEGAGGEIIRSLFRTPIPPAPPTAVRRADLKKKSEKEAVVRQTAGLSPVTFQPD